MRNNADFARRASSRPRPRSSAPIPKQARSKCARAWVAISAAAGPTLECSWPCLTRRMVKEVQMPKAEWPIAAKRTHIGKSYDRADGPAKATGTAKYSYDVNRPGMLFAKLITSPHPHAQVVSIDGSAAEKLNGVKAVWKDE